MGRHHLPSYRKCRILFTGDVIHIIFQGNYIKMGMLYCMVYKFAENRVKARQIPDSLRPELKAGVSGENNLRKFCLEIIRQPAISNE